MKSSPVFKSSPICSTSPDGTLVATLLGSKLLFRSCSSFEIVRTISLSPEFTLNVRFLRWSRHDAKRQEETESGGLRLLLADDDNVRAYEPGNPEWSANITGASGGVGRIENVEFGSGGNEILVFSEHGIKLTIWDLIKGRSVEIKDPKFALGGHGYRPRTRHFAILTRPAAHDVLSIHSVSDYRTLASLILPTVDAQGLKWCPCGRWIAVWDSPSSGHMVLIYTADGHLYRTYSGGGQKEETKGLGIKSLKWSDDGNYLALGDHDKRVTLLDGSTFSPIFILEHMTTIKLPNIAVWQEHVSPSGERTFSLATKPACPPTVSSLPTDASPKLGTSALSFDHPNSSLLATRCDNMPTTIWIWSLKLLSPRAVIIHHSPVKSLAWHPTCGGLLMTQCLNQQGGIYAWSADWDGPRALETPLERMVGRCEASWLASHELDQPASDGQRNAAEVAELERAPRIFLGDTAQYALINVLEKGLEDQWAPLGRSSLEGQGGFAEDVWQSDELTSHSFEDGPDLDDTFRYRKTIGGD